MRSPRYRARASAPASRTWSLLSIPTSIGCARTPTTFSAQWNGTRVVDRRTDCCQATTSSKRRLGRRTRPKSAPEPTALQLDFIRASEEEAAARLSEQRKQLEAVAAAQAAREIALHNAEAALKQAADAQRRRARIRNIALVVVSALAVLSWWLFLHFMRLGRVIYAKTPRPVQRGGRVWTTGRA